MTPGRIYTVTGWVKRSAGASNNVFMRIEFKDQAQNIIRSSSGAVPITSAWATYTNSAVAPTNAWSVSVVLQLQGRDTTVQFDDVDLSSSAFQIVNITRQGNDIVVTWNAVVGFTNVLQFATGAADGSYSNNYTDLSPVIFMPGSGFVITNFSDVGGATSNPARFYRVRLVP